MIRLSDEASLMILAESITNYYVRVGNFRAASAVALMNVEHLYYKHDKVAEAVHKSYLFTKKYGKYGDLHPACSGKALLPFGSTAVQHPGSFMGNPAVVSENFNPRKRLNDLCSFIYNHGDERSKTRALLCSVFHHAIHDRYHVARDLFLISHIQDFIEKADVRTQILFNRTLVVLGLCAFRLGFFQKAFESLSGICSGRARELLAQGQMKWADKDPEQEKLERRRQMPYHMHINPDLMECCHLTCAMLLELPNLARNGGSLQNTPIISKQFRKFLHAYNRSMFAGPPENTRDHVMAATKAVLDGNWKKACDYILNLEVWNLIPNDGGEKVKEMLRVRIQEEAVRTYLLINGAHYDTIGLDHICSLFDMEKSVVRRIISKMIFLRELSAAWDPNDILVMYHTDVSQLQTLSQGLVEKLSALIESNERLLDPLAGVYGYKDDWNTRDKKSQWQENSNANRRPGPRAQGFKPNPGGRGGRGGGRGSGGRSGRGWNGKKSGQTSKYSESQGNNKRAWNTPNANPASN